MIILGLVLLVLGFLFFKFGRKIRNKTVSKRLFATLIECLGVVSFLTGVILLIYSVLWFLGYMHV